MDEGTMDHYVERFKQLLLDFEEDIANVDYEEGYDDGYEDGVESAKEDLS